MKMIIKPRRKDNKYPVVLSFDNGVVLKKLFTAEQVEEYKAKADNYKK